MSSRGGSSRQSKGKGLASGSEQQPPPPPRFEEAFDLSEDEIEACFASLQQEGEAQTESQPPTQTQSRRAPPLRSDIFSVHFKKIPDLATGGFKVTCNYCTNSYKFRGGGGYGTFTNHLNKKHPDKVGLDRAQTQLPTGFTGSSTGMESSSSLFKYTDINARKETALFVSGMSLPFNFVDNKKFERYTRRAFNPADNKISRSTLTRDIRSCEFKFQLINSFASLQTKVSICSDVWSDHWQRSFYMGITCHWVDDSWTLQKRLIAYRDFNVEHTAINISHKIHTILQEYGLVTKIFSISFDNASANTASLPSLINICESSIGGKFFHVRCICHIINLCVQDGLATLKEEIAPIRDALLYLNRFSSVLKKWARYCKENNLYPRKFSPDVPTRWNSTYKMINDSYAYREALCSFFADQQCGIVLFPNQWDACSNLCQLLKVFKDATEELSGVYYPTSILVVDRCVKIALLFRSLMPCATIGPTIAQMGLKWLKYFTYIPNVFLVAKILDPRVRLDGLEELLGIYYDALFPIKEHDTPIPSVVVENAKQCLYDIFKEYSIKFGDSFRGSSSSAISTPDVEHTSDIGTFNEASVFAPLDNFYDARIPKRSRGGTTPYLELDTYLTSPFDYTEFVVGNSKFDLLKWWSKRSSSFPIVTLIAREILAVPASTVSVEQAFSEGGYILDPRRSRLTVQSLEAQVLLHDWTNAEVREQHVDFDDSEESDNLDTDSSNGSQNN